VKAFTDALRMELEHDQRQISITLIKPAAIDTHTLNMLKTTCRLEPKHPSPVYAPEVVADAILHCAQNAVRDMFAGGGAKGLSLAAYYAPRITDVVMQNVMFEAQKTEQPTVNHEGTLNSPSNDPRESGVYRGHVFKRSLYTMTAQHPVAAGGLLLGVAALGYELSKLQKRRLNRIGQNLAGH
jgi:hypothetical protein